MLLVLTPGTYTMPPMTARTMHLQELAAHELRGMREDGNQWMVDEEALLERYRSGKASLAETLAEYQLADENINSMPAMKVGDTLEKLKSLQLLMEKEQEMPTST